MPRSLRVLRDPTFRNLFLGQSASAVGDQVIVVALALYVTRTTGSASDLGLVLAAQVLPLIVFVLIGGVIADRLPRQAVMLVSDVVRAALQAIVAAMILTGGASVGELIALQALYGAARAFFAPAYGGLLPQTVDPELLQEAQALSATTANLAILLGPALGTALVLGFGAGTAFAFDAATFVLSAALLTRVRPRPHPSTADADAASQASMLRELRDGWHEVSSRPWVAAVIGAFTIAMCTGYAAWYSLAPEIARDLYGGAAVFGVLESVAGGGALLGAVIGMRWRPRRPMVVGLLLTAPWALQSIAFALDAPLALVIVLAFLAGTGFALFEIFWDTALATHIPAHALARVSSYDWLGSLGLLPLGFVAVGPLAAALGPRRVLIAAAAVGGVAVLGALIPSSTRALTGTAGPSASGAPGERTAAEPGRP